MAKIIGAPTLDDALAALRGEIVRAEERGERNLIFCEDRLTLLAERAVLAGTGGTFLTEVTTFARFLSGPRVLSKQGSVLEISALMQEHEEELVCFRPRAAQTVYETIAQLSASRVDADMLAASAEATEGTLRGKLKDLALLLRLYGERLREKGIVDENGYLALLPQALSSPAVRGTNVCFFGFPSFTKQALEGVRAALSNAGSVTGVFLAGRTGLYTNEAARQFRRVCEETGDAQPSMVKCSLEGDALALRDGLFSPEKLNMGQLTAEHIRRFTAADEAEEFSVVAALVKRHVSMGARYRDIAVLVGDKESFPAVEKAFSAFEIPFFADKKRPFSEHPFCTLVLDALSAVSDGVLPDEADAVAANYYFGDGDAYRNYLLKYGGYRGGVRREIKEGDAVKGYDRPALVACRERMLAILEQFPRKGKGSAFTAGVRGLEKLLSAEERTEALREFFTGAEREFLRLTPLEGVLAEFESVAADRVFTAREFRDGLQSALSALEISMIPQFLDAVFVGDATESKFERVPVLFVTGLTNALPRVSHDTAVITDGEMDRLAEIKVEIEPAIAQVNARARESLGLNLCSFTEALYLSRPLKLRGEDTEPSEILRYAEKLFRMPPMPSLFPFDCCEAGPAALKLLSLREGFRAGRENDSRLFSTLYEGLGQPQELLETEKEQVPAAGELIFAGNVSPTLLEGYFACPYQGFASRALRLREREERTVLDTDAGTFVHAVLEETAKRFNEFGDEAACRAFAHDAGRALLRARFAALADTGAGRYTGERLVEEGAEVSAACFRQLAGSAFRVKETEGAVELPELSLAGKTDRIDVSDDYIRVIDYKTGGYDDSPTAYYTGRKLQLELYLRAAARGGRAAGAFYFPASNEFIREGDVRFRMSGFYCGEDDVMTRLDASLEENGTSLFFEGRRGAFTDKGMPREDFEAFLDYSLLVTRRAEDEIRAGNIRPSPYEGACKYCKMRSLCGFVGSPRREDSLKCSDIAAIVRRERGDK